MGILAREAFEVRRTLRQLARGLLTAGLLVMTSGRVGHAQTRAPAGAQVAPGARPAVSPYLDLARRGDPGLNYYRRVRPELEVRGAINQQGLAINQLQRQAAAATAAGAAGAAGTAQTGHHSSFMNYSHFYSLPGR
jgi:hypothetical protein